MLLCCKLKGSVQLCSTWEPTSTPRGGGWRGWSLQELLGTAEPLTALAMAVVAGMLWGSLNGEERLCPLPHEHEISGFAALHKLQQPDKMQQESHTGRELLLTPACPAARSL